MNEKVIKETIAKNIVTYRKHCNLTQAQLAEKINYSDKAVSKWERGDGVPDTMVMIKLCEIFGVTLNDLVSEKVKQPVSYSKRNRVLVSILSALLVWLVAVIVFVIITAVLPNNEFAWLSYIFAMPTMFIVLLVFASLWGNKWLRLLFISALIWTLCVSIYIPVVIFTESLRPWLIFIVGIPVQVLFLFFTLLKKKQKNS